MIIQLSILTSDYLLIAELKFIFWYGLKLCLRIHFNIHHIIKCYSWDYFPFQETRKSCTWLNLLRMKGVTLAQSCVSLKLPIIAFRIDIAFLLYYILFLAVNISSYQVLILKFRRKTKKKKQDKIIFVSILFDYILFVFLFSIFRLFSWC